MKYTYTVQSYYLGEWIDIVRATRDFCEGFVYARKDYAPRNAYRIMRSDGKVTTDFPAVEEVSVGQVAGWPTPEQYEGAAKRAMDQATRIRDQAAKQELMRETRRAKTP